MTKDLLGDPLRSRTIGPLQAAQAPAIEAPAPASAPKTAGAPEVADVFADRSRAPAGKPLAGATAATARPWAHQLVPVGPLSRVSAALTRSLAPVEGRSGDAVLQKIGEALHAPGALFTGAVFDATGFGVQRGLGGKPDPWMPDDSLRPLFEALGPAALPLLAEYPWRLEGLVAGWKLDEAGVEKVIEAFAKGPRDVYRNVANALLASPHLDDAMKRRVAMSELDGAAGRALPDAVAVEDLGDRLLGSPKPSERYFLAELLDTGALGFSALDKAERDAAIQQLLRDPSLDVRLAAAPMFWQQPKTSKADQAAVLAILDDPKVKEDARLSTIFSMGWSRETASLWGTPNGLAERLVDQRAELLGRLIERAPERADLTFLVDEIAKVHDQPRVAERSGASRVRDPSPGGDRQVGLAEVAANRILASSMNAGQQAVELGKLYGTAQTLSAFFEPVVTFAGQHPLEASTFMQPMMMELIHYRYDRVGVRFDDATIEAWKRQISLADGLREGIREIAERHPAAPVFRRALGMPPAPEAPLDVRLQTFAAALEDPKGYPHGLAPMFEALVDQGGSPEATKAELERALSVALPWAAKFYNHVNAVPPATFRRAVELLGDKRVDPDFAAKLLQDVVATGTRTAVWAAIAALEPKGLSRDVIARLTAARSDLFLDIVPGRRSVEVPARPEVMRDYLDGQPEVSKEALRKDVELVLQKAPEASWKEQLEYARWNAGHDPMSEARAPIPFDFCRRVRAGEGYDALRARFHAEPLAWADAELARGAKGPGAALEVLIRNPPLASPLWRGALLEVAATAKQISPEARQALLVEGMMPGYWGNTSADFTWDAEAALQAWDGPSLDFAKDALVRHASTISDIGTKPKDFFALEPLLLDKRLSSEAVTDVLLAATDNILRPRDPKVMAEGFLPLLVRVLDERYDLRPEDRAALGKAGRLVVSRWVFGSGEVSREKEDKLVGDLMKGTIAKLVDHQAIAWRAAAADVPSPKRLTLVDGLVAVFTDPHIRGDAVLAPPTEVWFENTRNGLTSGPHGVALSTLYSDYHLQQALARPAEAKLGANYPDQLIRASVGWTRGRLTSDPPGARDVAAYGLEINLGAIEKLRQAGVPLDKIKVESGMPNYGGGGELSVFTEGPSPLPAALGALELTVGTSDVYRPNPTKVTRPWGEKIRGAGRWASVTLTWVEPNGARHDLVSSALSGDRNPGFHSLGYDLATAERAARFGLARAG